MTGFLHMILWITFIVAVVGTHFVYSPVYAYLLMIIPGAVFHVNWNIVLIRCSRSSRRSDALVDDNENSEYDILETEGREKEDEEVRCRNLMHDIDLASAIHHERRSATSAPVSAKAALMEKWEDMRRTIDQTLKTSQTMKMFEFPANTNGSPVFSIQSYNDARKRVQQAIEQRERQKLADMHSELVLTQKLRRSRSLHSYYLNLILTGSPGSHIQSCAIWPSNLNL